MVAGIATSLAAQSVTFWSFNSGMKSRVRHYGHIWLQYNLVNAASRLEDESRAIVGLAIGGVDHT